MINKIKSKKGNATVYLIIILALVLIIAGMFIRLNWRRFKAEASFGFTVALIVIAVIVVIFLMIRHSIRKAAKERDEKKAEKEREKLEKQAKEGAETGLLTDKEAADEARRRC